MRRLLSLALVVALIGVALGCNHTAGVCDCDPGFNGHGVAPAAAVPVPATIVK